MFMDLEPPAGRLETLAEQFRARPGSTDTQAVALGKLRTAWDLTAAYVGREAYVPEAVLDEALLLTAGEVEARRKSPGGVLAVYGDQTGAVRLAQDPMKLAYPLLARFIPGGFA